MSVRRIQPYRGTIGWLVQRVCAIALVVLIPLKMYTGYGVMGKVPWFPNGSVEEVHASAAIDITILFCLLLHAFYGIRIIMIDFNWIPDDKYFWRTTALAAVIFAWCVYYLYIKG